LIKGGSQGEVVNLERVAVRSKVTIDLNSGRNNAINIGSLEPSMGGVLTGIAGTVNVGGNRTVALNIDDSGSKTARSGVLTRRTLTGLGLGTGGIAYSGMKSLNIELGTRDTLNVKSKASGTTTRITGGTVTPTSASRTAVATSPAIAGSGRNATPSVRISGEARLHPPLIASTAAGSTPDATAVDLLIQHSSDSLGLTATTEDNGIEGIARALVKKHPHR
jgi:hypothetical protein